MRGKVVELELGLGLGLGAGCWLPRGGLAGIGVLATRLEPDANVTARDGPLGVSNPDMDQGVELDPVLGSVGSVAGANDDAAS